MKEALFYQSLKNSKVQCNLCPHNCIINNGKRGSCKVRKNIDGKLYSENYEQLCSVSFDPIEKKPLYHFHPGKQILSVGSIGCNLHCKFCQNFKISQSTIDDYDYLNVSSAKEVIQQARLRNENIGIAFTYNEPIVWYEYMLEIAELAKRENLKTVMVTNGYINPEPLAKLIPLMDAFSVDLKAFSQEFYTDISFGGLQPVLDSIKQIHEHGKHLEITNLVITDSNDDAKEFEDMVNWIAKEIGTNTVLHISRYHPMYKMDKPATAVEKLNEFYKIAKEKLDHVYLGNVSTENGQNTYCSKCGELVIGRMGYSINIEGLNKDGKCKKCSATL